MFPPGLRTGLPGAGRRPSSSQRSLQVVLPEPQSYSHPDPESLSAPGHFRYDQGLISTMTQRMGPVRCRPQGSHSNLGLKERVSPPDPPGHIPSPPQSPAEVGGSGARGGGRGGLFRTHCRATPLCLPHAACIRCRPQTHRFTAFCPPYPLCRETEVGRPFLPRGNTSII